MSVPRSPAGTRLALALLAAPLLLAACATHPPGPRVTTLPGTGRSFDQFRHDEHDCRRYAGERVAGRGNPDAALKGAAVGTVVGALAGAAIGGREAAGAGAGLGLVTGTLAGAGEARHGDRGSQRDYDAAYAQCMYARGHRVPVAGPLRASPPVPPPGSAPAYPPPRTAYAPATPGTYPPPPPPPPPGWRR